MGEGDGEMTENPAMAEDNAQADADRSTASGNGEIGRAEPHNDGDGEDDNEPSAKRARAGTLSVVMSRPAKMVGWTDLADRPDCPK